MAFSGALTLTDLNDFITPSQACVKPVEQTNAPQTSDPSAAETQIQVDASGSYYEVSTNQGQRAGPSQPRKLETAQISLNDCLACSGCITSAESVLITMQSHEEVNSVLISNPPTICVDHKTSVLSISPQSLASLAASINSSSCNNVTLYQVLHRVEAFAKSIGFEHVYDTTFARHIALMEHAREFRERKSQSSASDLAAPGKLPMLASACPGWVCYAEKTHAEMLPFISNTKSPQQVMGTIVKEWMGRKWGKSPKQIYHVTVMPCYDKKLEASRQDFYNDLYSTRDVDCVITTGELELMMRERSWDLSKPDLDQSTGHPNSAPPNKSDRDATPTIQLPSLLTHPGSSSGSYLHSLLSAFSAQNPDAELTTRQIRGGDFEEYVLRSPTGDILFKGARCYGFRNLQNVVRKVGRAAGVQVGRGAAGRLANIRARVKKRPGKDENDEEVDKAYDYVEVMACPSGCINGGGQIRPVKRAASEVVESKESQASLDSRWGDREWTKHVESAYWHDLPTPPPSPPPEISDVSSVNAIEQLQSRASAFANESAASTRLKAADALAVSLLSDLCIDDSSRAKCRPTSWSDTMDEKGEKLRREFFCTNYRAVQSEVIGLQVQW